MRVEYYKSRCDYCKMLFQEKSFGAELELVNDSLRKFDATECLAAFLIDNRIPEARIRKVWAVDYSRPTVLVDGRKAVYIRSDSITSPMEVNIAAFGSRKAADSVYTRVGGEQLSWRGVLDLIRTRWFREPQKR